MNFLSRLFSKSPAKPAAAPDPILHKSCRIYPTPIKEAGGYRIAARVEKDFDGVTKTHNLQRADTHAGLDDAVEATIGKCKQAIDQLGDTLFG